MFYKLTKIICAILFTPTLALAAVGGGVDDFGMEDHSKECDTKANIQHISVADFNGSGTVNDADIEMLIQAIENHQEAQKAIDEGDPNARSRYAAFFDINNDGDLDNEDLKIAQKQIGLQSTDLDQEIASLYAFASQFDTMEKALRAGYLPFTQEYQSHGYHLMRFPDFDPSTGAIIPESNILDGNFVVNQPEGLNFDRNGNLVGVYYYIGPDLEVLFDPALRDAHFWNWFNLHNPEDNYLSLRSLTARFLDENGNPDPTLTSGTLNPFFQEDLELEFTGHSSTVPKPIGFIDNGEGIRQDHWHFHQGICERGIWTMYNKVKRDIALGVTIDDNYVKDIADNYIDTRQCDSAVACFQEPINPDIGQPDAFYMPKFYMLHVWLFTKNNRCGIMWGTHEDVSVLDVPLEEGQILDEVVASEPASFVFQPLADYLDSDSKKTLIENKNYRKLCLSPALLSYDYEEIRTLISESPEFAETLVCPPAASGIKDPECAIHVDDLP